MTKLRPEFKDTLSPKRTITPDQKLERCQEYQRLYAIGYRGDNLHRRSRLRPHEVRAMAESINYDLGPCVRRIKP